MRALLGRTERPGVGTERRDAVCGVWCVRVLFASQDVMRKIRCIFPFVSIFIPRPTLRFRSAKHGELPRKICDGTTLALLGCVRGAEVSNEGEAGLGQAPM